jgi:N-acetylneuraminic acid mutarotase
MAFHKRLNSRFEDLKDFTCNPPIQRESHLLESQDWTEIKTSSSMLNKRAHHATVVLNNCMYLYGGYEAGGAGILSDFMFFDIEAKQWKQVISQKSTVGSRHSHSLAAWGNKLYLFGGIFNTFESSNQIYSFEIGTSTNWKE